MTNPASRPPSKKRGRRLILASASAARAKLLRAAGVSFAVRPAGIDEKVLKATLKREGIGAEQAALALAERKARAISAVEPKALVIGCDQLLECDREWFDKPATRAAARAQLLYLCGRSHRLATAAVVLEGGKLLWQDVSSPRLRMRRFSEAFLEDYLRKAKGTVQESVGGYRLEGPGAQLFESIEGDYFSVLGLPLLALLAFLRSQGVIAT